MYPKDSFKEKHFNRGNHTAQRRFSIQLSRDQLNLAKYFTHFQVATYCYSKNWLQLSNHLNLSLSLLQLYFSLNQCLEPMSQPKKWSTSQNNFGKMFESLILGIDWISQDIKAFLPYQDKSKLMMLTLQLHLQKEISTAFSLSSMNNNLFQLMTYESIVTQSKWSKVSLRQQKLQTLISAPHAPYFLVLDVQYASTVNFFMNYKKRLVSSYNERKGFRS